MTRPHRPILYWLDATHTRLQPRQLGEMSDHAYHALDIAQTICRAAHEPMSYQSCCNNRAAVVTLIFNGKAQGVYGMEYGWRNDGRETQTWHMEQACIALNRRYPVYDRDAVLAEHMRGHMLASHIISAWQHAGLVDHIEDRSGYLPERNLSTLARSLWVSPEPISFIIPPTLEMLYNRLKRTRHIEEFLERNSATLEGWAEDMQRGVLLADEPAENLPQSGLQPLPDCPPRTALLDEDADLTEEAQ